MSLARPTLARLARRLAATLSTAALLAACAANWLVHQPRRWQEAQTARLHPTLATWTLRLGNAFADTTDALGLTGQDASVALATPPDPHAVAPAGLPRRAPGSPAPDDITVLRKTGHTVGYSPSLRHPVWVAYRTYPTTNSVAPPRPRDFKADPAAPGSPTHKDYAKSGYDRGHLAPNHAIAVRLGRDAQRQTFLTSNICPQRPSLNQGPWCNLEFRLSELWPARYGDVWIIAGAFTPPDGVSRLPSGVAIPAGFYQIAVSYHDGRLRGLAVYLPQNVRRRDFARASIVSIDDLESLTGLDFLADLPDEAEDALEAQTPTRLWPSGLVGAARLIAERFRTYD